VYAISNFILLFVSFSNSSLADDSVVAPLMIMGGSPGQIVGYLNESFAFQRERESRAAYASFKNQ
jgi:H+/Cl- antiporter ClcA